jgi:hypothetical protein
LNTGNLKKSIAAFIALTYVFAVVGSAVEDVLCIDPDGSVSIEYAENGACTSGPDANAERSGKIDLARSSAASNSHCGSCIDLSFGAGELDNQAVIHRNTSSVNLYMVTESRLDVAGRWTAQAGLSDTKTASSTTSTLTCLRSVCLQT